MSKCRKTLAVTFIGNSLFIVFTMIIVSEKVSCFNSWKRLCFNSWKTTVSDWLNLVDLWVIEFKDTERGKAKTPALTKSMTMDIWVVGTSNQLFIRVP